MKEYGSVKEYLKDLVKRKMDDEIPQELYHDSQCFIDAEKKTQRPFIPTYYQCPVSTCIVPIPTAKDGYKVSLHLLQSDGNTFTHYDVEPNEAGDFDITSVIKSHKKDAGPITEMMLKEWFSGALLSINGMACLWTEDRKHFIGYLRVVPCVVDGEWILER